MAWIESHQSLLTHRKTGRLSRVLRTSRVTSIGHLHAVWWWCMDNAPDGDISDIEPEELAEAAMWDGDANLFLDALIQSGFVDQNDGELVLHDWHDYAGKLIDKRKNDADRKRRERASDVQRTSSGQATDVQSDGAGTKPTVPTKPTNKTPPSPSVGFDEFYSAYPKKVGKAVAEKSWRSLKPDETQRTLIMAGLERAKVSPQWTKDGGQFIPNPSTWLNQRRWEDEYQPPLRPAPNGAAGNVATDDVDPREQYRRQSKAAFDAMLKSPDEYTPEQQLSICTAFKRAGYGVEAARVAISLGFEEFNAFDP